MRLVEITWRDSYSVNADEWQGREAMDGEVHDVIVVTVGLLYRVAERYVVVINSVSEVHDSYWGAMVIAKSAIIKARELK